MKINTLKLPGISPEFNPPSKVTINHPIKPLAKKKLSFTLVELLVVIGIISLLMIMWLPALSKVRETGRKTHCIHNLKGLGLANANYASDYQVYVPARSSGIMTTGQQALAYRASSSTPWDTSRGTLAIYSPETSKLARCVTNQFLTPQLQPFIYGYNWFGVGSNHYLVGYDGSNWNHGSSLKPEQIESPSYTIMFGDCAHLFSGSLREDTQLNLPYSIAGVSVGNLKTKKPSTTLNFSKFHFRHNGSANCAWVDGHVTTERMHWSSDEDRKKLRIGNFGPQDNSYYDPWKEDIPDTP